MELLRRLSQSPDSIEKMTLLFQLLIRGRQDFISNGLCPARQTVVARVDSFFSRGFGRMVLAYIPNCHTPAKERHCFGSSKACALQRDQPSQFDSLQGARVVAMQACTPSHPPACFYHTGCPSRMLHDAFDFSLEACRVASKTELLDILR